MNYNDTCDILRPTGSVDSWDNPVTEPIYSGECLYQEKTTVSYPDGIVTRAPLVFLPSNDVSIQIDDIIEIATEGGRTINGIVSLVRDIKLLDKSYTRISVKTGRGE